MDGAWYRLDSLNEGQRAQRKGRMYPKFLVEVLSEHLLVASLKVVIVGTNRCKEVLW